MIDEYLDRLARELAFDPAIARRVRREAEDHLREAVAADPVGGLEAERRAIASFGDPGAIARQLAAVSLARQSRRAGVAAVVVIAIVFAAMKARLAWYALVQWPAADGWQAVVAFVLSIDRWTFGLSFAAAAACWLYVERLRIPAALTAAYRARLRRFLLLGGVATAALAASVAADAVLTALRLAGPGWSSASLVPAALVVLEAACAGVLIACVARPHRALRRTGILLKISARTP